MAGKLASEFLNQLGQANGDEKDVTTTLDAKSMAIVTRFRGGRSVRATVAALLAIAGETLEDAEAKRPAVGSGRSLAEH